MKKVIFYEGKYYSVCETVFKFECRRYIHYVNYNKLLQKSKLINKMHTVDISEQKDIMCMKIDIDSSTMEALIEYIEHDRITSKTYINWEELITTCDYLSIDVELLKGSLSLKKKLETKDKTLVKKHINDRLMGIFNYNVRVFGKGEEDILEDMKKGDYMPIYTSFTHKILEEILNKF